MFWKVLGSLFLLKYGVRLLQFLWMLMRLYFLPRFGMRKDLKKYGSWAVITGSTDGIGKAVAKELAKRRINVVLISRSADKLDAVAEEFAPFGVEVKTIAYDFSDVNNYEVIENGLQDLEVGILVNNVGMAYEMIAPQFHEVSSEWSNKTVSVNCASVQKMTRIVLRGMLQRKRGLIVHVSSAFGLRPVPLATLYSATKAFVAFFSKGLHYEYVDSGIYNQVITPAFVATKMTGMEASGITVPSADCFAQAAVNTFGLTTKNMGCWAHEIQATICEALPDFMWYRLIANLLIGVRKEWLSALRKQEQKQDSYSDDIEI